jgi:hypothetical protein
VACHSPDDGEVHPKKSVGLIFKWAMVGYQRMDEIKRQPIEGLKPYENQWVAIYETEAERTVVDRGDDAANFTRLSFHVRRSLPLLTHEGHGMLTMKCETD